MPVKNGVVTLMRASEILAAMLLKEAGPKTVALAIGPGLPEQGYYVSGNTNHQIYTKLASKLGTKGSEGLVAGEQLVRAWMLRGFSVVMRNEIGQIVLYADKPIQLGPQAINIFGLKSSTGVMRYIRKPDGTAGFQPGVAARLLGVQ